MEKSLSDLREMNELDHLVMCPRCGDAVPVYIKTVTKVDRYGTEVTHQLHCIKCHEYGHQFGDYICHLDDE